MKQFVVWKMIFIFIYLILAITYIIAEINDPCLVSFLRGIGATLFIGALIKDIMDIVRKKDTQ